MGRRVGGEVFSQQNSTESSKRLQLGAKPRPNGSKKGAGKTFASLPPPFLSSSEKTPAEMPTVPRLAAQTAAKTQRPADPPPGGRGGAGARGLGGPGGRGPQPKGGSGQDGTRQPGPSGREASRGAGAEAAPASSGPSLTGYLGRQAAVSRCPAGPSRGNLRSSAGRRVACEQRPGRRAKGRSEGRAPGAGPPGHVAGPPHVTSTPRAGRPRA